MWVCHRLASRGTELVQYTLRAYAITAGIDDKRYRAILQDVAEVCQLARSFAVKLWLQCFPRYVDNLAQHLKDYSTVLRTLEAEAGEDKRTGNELDPCEVYFTFGSQLQALRAAGTLSVADYEWFSVLVRLAIAELDFGSPEGSEGLRGESPERMEEVPVALAVPAPLSAASSLGPRRGRLALLLLRVPCRASSFLLRGPLWLGLVSFLLQ